MAGVWQIHKMHQSIGSVVDFHVRRYLFEHGGMGKIKSCRKINDSRAILSC